jgi:BASS family bile acid:Na+ symporter
MMHGLVHASLSQLVTFLALEVGLALDGGALRRELSRPVLWRTLVVALLGVPMLAILIAVALPLGPVERGVLVLMSVSPGAPMLMNKARKSGRMELAVALAVALTLAAVAFVPIEVFVLNRLFPWRLQVSAPALLRALVPKLLIPLALGAIVRRVWPRGANALQPIARVLFDVALVIAAIGALAVSWRVLVQMSPWAWLAMLLVTLGAALLGDAFGGRDPRDRSTAAFAVVLGNPAVAMTVASLSYPTLHVLPVILAYALLRAVFVLPYAVMSRSRSEHFRTSGTRS